MLKIIIALSPFYLTGAGTESGNDSNVTSLITNESCNFTLKGEILHGDKYCIYGENGKSLVVRQRDTLNCLPCIDRESKTPGRIIIIPE